MGWTRDPRAGYVCTFPDCGQDAVWLVDYSGGWMGFASCTTCALRNRFRSGSRKGADVDAWRSTLRKGFIPLMSTGALVGAGAGAGDGRPEVDPGGDDHAPALQAVQDWPCEAADFVGYGGWQGDGLDTVGEVEEFFARLCFECDNRLGEPAGCKHWLNYWDETPRNEAFENALWEVRYALETRDNALLDPAKCRTLPALLTAIGIDPNVRLNWSALADLYKENDDTDGAERVRGWLQPKEKT